MTEPATPDALVAATPGAEPRPAVPTPAEPRDQRLEAYELPTARQVVGRGLQLAYDSTQDLRRASLYIGLYTAAVVGPFVVLLLVDIPKFGGLDFSSPEAMTPAQAALLLRLIGPLYGAGALALLGFLTVEVDGLLMAISLLAARAVGRPLELREAVARARQVFWRYSVAAFVVGLISIVVTFAILFALGAFRGTGSLGASLLASFISTLIVLPFGYVATAIVIGDVTGGAALRRSVVLVRARFRLAFAVAAFAFVASALQTFGLGIASEVVGLVAGVLHPDLDLTGPGLLLAIPLVFIALMALGSLSITVDAVTVAPQVAAFLGLTRYSGGIDRARRATPQVTIAAPGATVAIPSERDPSLGDELAPDALATELAPQADVEPGSESILAPRLVEQSTLAVPPSPPSPVQTAKRTRWITIPMAMLVGLEAFIAVIGVLRS